VVRKPLTARDDFGAGQEERDFYSAASEVEGKETGGREKVVDALERDKKESGNKAKRSLLRRS